MTILPEGFRYNKWGAPVFSPPASLQLPEVAGILILPGNELFLSGM